MLRVGWIGWRWGRREGGRRGVGGVGGVMRGGKGGTRHISLAIAVIALHQLVMVRELT